MTQHTLHLGDCLDVLRTLPDNSVDSVVTDPPYGLSFMGKRWDYDVPAVEVWAECLRVLKPGGHLLAFAGTRTQHRMAVRIEDAGFEIRDMIAWVYSTGFPKSLNITKATADIACQCRSSAPSHRPQPDEQRQVKSGVVAGQRQPQKSGAWDLCPGCSKPMVPDGFGTSLKPSLEPITVARKPLSGTVAETVTTWGTGAINVDGCRVPGEKPDTTRGASIKAFSSPALLQQGRIVDDGLGRFPANLIHDGSDEVVGLFPQAPSAGKYKHPEKQKNVGERGADWSRHLFRAEANKRRDNKYAGDSGSAARFFYCAKASKEDRDEGCDALPFRESAEMVDRDEDSAGIKSPRAGAGRKNGARNFHPTVKPTDLMRYLCRLVTPPGGTVLDPFMGSGSTGKGALEEGFRFIGIERDPEYFKIAEVRIPPRQPRLF
jgi:DNA modification methylase